MVSKLIPQPSSLCPLIVIVGETASGKSALALELGERWNGEIICADSRTVYRGMDIGTAKPNTKEQKRVPHHMIDVVSPNEPFNVVNFQGRTLEIIKDINKMGKLPILVGGTGLYVDSIVFNYGFSKSNTERDPINLRHMKPGQEVTRSTEPRVNTLVLGLSVPKEELDNRIIERVNLMLKAGLEHEVRSLVDKHGWQAEAMTGVGYHEWQAYFADTQTLAETKQLIIIHTRQYAKRQRAWFKRNNHINWVSDIDSAQEKVINFLQRL
jgi:tRNA dimethylallyltransferase